LVVLTPILIGSCSPDEKTADRTPPEKIKTLKEMSPEQRHTFLKGYAGDWRGDTDRSKGLPPPPIEKPCPPNARLIDLVRPDQIKVGAAPLAAVINQRRSRRSYTTASLSNEELSFLLWSTQGIAKTDKDEKGQIINHFRTVPSGGARHPFETYLIVNRVEGMDPGIYRYLPVEHKLVWLREEKDLAKAITDACYGQEYAGQAAVVFIWTAIPYRTEWAYGYVAPKLIAVDAGHVCENLYLAAESIGAGACAILGYGQTRLDQLIQVDGKDEFAFYVASVGKIDKTTSDR
jgi:SagB-type dehydrogenase family enzyme